MNPLGRSFFSNLISLLDRPSRRPCSLSFIRARCFGDLISFGMWLTSWKSWSTYLTDETSRGCFKSPLRKTAKAWFAYCLLDKALSPITISIWSSNGWSGRSLMATWVKMFQKVSELRFSSAKLFINELSIPTSSLKLSPLAALIKTISSISCQKIGEPCLNWLYIWAISTNYGMP